MPVRSPLRESSMPDRLSNMMFTCACPAPILEIPAASPWANPPPRERVERGFMPLLIQNKRLFVKYKVPGQREKKFFAKSQLILSCLASSEGFSKSVPQQVQTVTAGSVSLSLKDVSHTWQEMVVLDILLHPFFACSPLVVNDEINEQTTNFIIRRARVAKIPGSSINLKGSILSIQNE